MATAIEHRVIIPQNPLSQEQQQTFHSEGDIKTTDIDTNDAEVAVHDQNAMIEKLKQNTFMDTPSAGALNNPPPPYSQRDYYLEQLLQVLNGHLSQGGQKEKNGDMLDKMTQLESLVSSLQNILSNQTFAMHDLKSQLLDIQTLLKGMQDKQETMTSEDIMKQVVTMKALTENIMASSERQLDEGNIATEEDDIAEDPAETTNQVEEIKHSQTTQYSELPQQPLPQITEPTVEEIIPPFEPSTPLVSTVLTPPSRPVSRTTSRQTSRAPSRVQSRNTSRAPSRSASRTVSPARSPVLSRTSSKNKLDLPTSPSMHPYKGTMGPISEDDDDEEEEEDNSAFERMASILSTLITEATTAVEAPVKGREKKPRQDSNTSVMSRDYFEDFDWDALVDDDASVVDQSETGTVVSERTMEVVKDSSRKKEKKDSHYRRTKSRKEEEFQESFKHLDSSLAQVQCLISDMTEDLIMEEEAVIVKDRNGRLVREIKDKNGIVVREEPIMDPTQELLNNPSADLADLDDFAQQCRLLTRALILPFLHATHSFMSESLQPPNQPNAPRSVTSTTRTFMNLMYWTFLFTLGSLVLDAWLCEVAGRQVIRMVDMLKPGQPFGFVQDSEPLYEIGDEYPDNGMMQVDDGKKKNVKIRRLKSVSWRGVGMSVGSGQRWLRNSAQNVMSLGRRGRRLLTAGGWGFNGAYQRSTLSREWDDEMSEDSDEWEIVDFGDSTDYSDDDEGDSGEEDPALTLRRRITDERSKRAGHVKFMTYNSNSDTLKKDERSSTVQENNASSPNEHCVDMQIEEMDGEQQPLPTNEASGIVCNEPNLTSEWEQNREQHHDEANIMEEDEEPLDDVDLQIPGSFPAAFRRAPSYTSTTTTEIMETDESSDKENVRRVRSVVLRQPKRNGPFGGSGGFWVMKTHKVRKRSSKKGDKSHSTNSKKEKNASALLKSSNTKSSPISKKKKSSSKRVWVRRNSI